MSKAITGEEYSLVASSFLLKQEYIGASFAADIAYFLGAASVALVWCKYHHNQIITRQTTDTHPFIVSYKLSEYFKIPGYLEFEELASAVWAAAPKLQSQITQNVMVHVKHLQAATKQYAGVKITLEKGLELVKTVSKPAESIFPPLALGPAQEMKESTHLLKDVSSPKYDGTPSNHHQDEVPVAGKQSIISKFFSCCFGGSGEE